MPRGVASAPAGDRLVSSRLVSIDLDLERSRPSIFRALSVFYLLRPLGPRYKSRRCSGLLELVSDGAKGRVWWPFPERRSESGAAHRASLGARVRAVRIGAEKRSHGTLGRTAARCQTPEATAVHKSSSVKLSAASSSSVSTRLTKSSALVA